MTGDQLSDKAKENLDSLDMKLKEYSIYWTFVNGEKKIGEFDPEKLPREVPSPFKENQTRYEFEVFDIRNAKLKYWNVAPSTARQLHAYLREGFRTLEIERVGTGMRTNWNINPVIKEEAE